MYFMYHFSIIRDLSAQGLHKLTSCSPDYMASQGQYMILKRKTFSIESVCMDFILDHKQENIVFS